MTARSFRRFITAVVIEAICIIVVGYFALNPEIVNPDSPAFSFTIFGLIGALLYNSLDSETRKIFLSLSTVVTLLLLSFWFENDTFISTSINILWFVLIGGLAFVTWKLLQAENIRNSLFLPLIVWLASWIAVYLVMTFLDIYVLAPRQLTTDVTASWYFLRGIGSGAILGLGMGVGFVLTRVLVRFQPSTGIP